MSTVTETPPEADLNSGEYDQFIDQRLERVRFHLKTLDLLTGMLQVGLFVLVSLLIVVLVDHWIWDLSVVARVGCLLGVAGVSVALVIRSVLLPLFRSINPDYAAQTVELAHPELKNGLISFLFFRSQKGLLRDGVFQGIEQQAAADLTSVPIDSAVDRSYLIKLGYGLVALVVVWVAYILLSPKSPLQTVQRVATPWKDIARPSQVQIEEVAPGDTEVYRGQTVEVRTKIFGLPEDTVPTIVYSTIDGQLANQSLPLTDDPSTGRYSGTLSMGTEGILQDLEYYIHAGDARSAKYRVRILDMPHIHVDRVQLDYPSYTQQATEIVQGEANLRAIEGTRVTVYATANQEIAQGQIVLQPTNDTEAPRRARLKIEASQREANFRFPLRLDGDRKQSLYRAYHLEFTNTSGQNSEDSIEHTIEVLPDRRPVVDVLRPDRRTIELPENGSLIMEVRAVDPDFQLTRVQLAARTRGRNLFRESLLSTTNAAEWHNGQFTATYRFVPKELDLREGDVVEYLALAEDNRHDPVNAAKLDPNRTISAKQYIRISKADPRAESKPQGKDDTTAAASDNSDSSEKNTQDDSEKNDKQQDQGESQGQEQRQGGDGEEQGQGQDANEEQAGNQAQQNQEQSQDGQNANEQSKDAGGNESGLQQDSDRGGETDQESEGGGKAGESSDDNSKADGNSSESGNQPSRGGQESQDGQQAGDSTGDPTSGENSQSGDGDAGNRGGRENEPLPSSGERDGEVVERIREYMKDKGELEEYERQLDESQESSDSQSPTESGANSEDPNKESESPADTNAAHSPSSASNSDESNASGGNEANADEQPEGSGSAGTADSNSSGDNAGDSADDSATSGASNPTGDNSETGTAEKATEGSSGKETSESTRAEGTSEQNPQDGRQGQAGEDSGEATSEDRGEGTSDDAAGTEGRPSDNGNQSERSPQDNAPQSTSDEGTQEDARDSNSNKDRETSDRSDGTSDSDTGKPDQDASQQDESSKSPGQNSNPSDSNNASSSNPTADRSKNQSTSPQQRPGRSQSASESRQTGSADAGDVDDTASGDAANLEYARESTDLVLEYLKDQKRKPNPELLEKLGWKQSDVDNFLRRWAQMKRDAQGSGTDAQKSKSKLDEILQGMGLRPPAAETRQVDAATDQQRNNRNTGRKQKIPKDLLDPFRAFQRGLQLDR